MGSNKSTKERIGGVKKSSSRGRNHRWYDSIKKTRRQAEVIADDCRDNKGDNVVYFEEYKNEIFCYVAFAIINCLQ